jgi:hypothetical protein
MQEQRSNLSSAGVLAAVLLLLGLTPAWGDGGITFTDVAEGDGAGVTYRHISPPRSAIYDQVIHQITPSDMFFGVTAPSTPMRPLGTQGLAIFDYDGDGDLDVYVANGPGAANSLYSSQLLETGELSFIDVALSAGADATDQETVGVCYGDVDNDGDQDLYLVGLGYPNRMLENQGDGTFTDITDDAGVEGPYPYRHGVSCSFADFDNDGLLDLVVANTYSGCDNPINPLTDQAYPCSINGDPTDPPQLGWEHRHPAFGSDTYTLLEHNVLFMNQGGNTFTDESAASGIEQVSNMDLPGLSGAAHTWAIATYDYDLDGDIDIHFADNQGSATNTAGLHRFYQNDGTGNFTEVTQALGLGSEIGSWMGLTVGDYNCDSRLDFFGTDIGVYVGTPGSSSRWSLQNPDGTYSTPGVGDLGGTPFGWGTSTFDYDNDGDLDIVYHGGISLIRYVVADNPGVVLQNQGCTGVFDWDAGAITRDHLLRMVNGVATGDLDDDGFFDVVSASSYDIVPGNPYIFPVTAFGLNRGIFDSVAAFQFVLSAGQMPGFFVPADPLPELADGTLSVEISSGDNGNGWVKSRLVGNAGILPRGTVNRNGIGAVVSFTPDGGVPAMQPVMGGSSFASQDALEVGFGLGDAASGTLEVLWPGGVRNRLYDVEDGERIVMPHIPCSFDAEWRNFGRYNACVMRTLNGYKRAGLITPQERNRLRDSARRAYLDAH